MIRFSLITSVLIIVKKRYNTLWKGLDIGYKSLENDHPKIITLKMIKLRLKLIDCGRKLSFLNKSLYNLITHLFFWFKKIDTKIYCQILYILDTKMSYSQ